MTIDWTFIQQRHDEILVELNLIQDITVWQIKPKNLVQTTHKTKYGMADVNGVIHINHAFVGTEAFQLLDATIRHEFAHLCVGLFHGHDATFKAKARQFKAHFGRHLKAESAQVHAAIGYKYRLYATLANGETLLFRWVHRTHAKYMKYKPSMFKYLTIKGQKVISFSYQ